MKTCKTCKHWCNYPAEEQESIIKLNWVHYCEFPYKLALNESSFGIVDGEPYNEGKFATGPEFGCIHHENKI